jgi:mRNA interferase MazF
LVRLALDPVVGHEQAGNRPAVVVSDDEVAESQRFPLVAIVPVTRTPGRGLLYPRLEPGGSGLKEVSFALCDQILSVDKRRVARVYGSVSAAELAAIDRGLRGFLGLP